MEVLAVSELEPMNVHTSYRRLKIVGSGTPMIHFL